jgi:hypothetical protein
MEVFVFLRPARYLAATAMIATTAAALGPAGFQLGSAVRGRPAIAADGPQLTLAFAGDVHFMRRTAALLAHPQDAIGPMAAVLSAADLAVVNLETPIARGGTPEKKRYLFRTDERAVHAIRAAGIDAVSLANNHSMDYGRAALAETLDTAGAGGLPTFGAGPSAREAFAPWRTTVRGTRIAVFGFSLVDDLAAEWAARADRSGVAVVLDDEHRQRALAAVRAARTDSDVVIVLPHWGTENKDCPNSLQKRFAAQLAGAGADVVIGAHAHVLQGGGWLGRTYVAYGLGNFVWYSSGLAPRAVNTGVLRLDLRGRTVVRHELVPAVVSKTGQPVPLSGRRANAERARFAGLRHCAGLREHPTAG